MSWPWGNALRIVLRYTGLGILDITLDTFPLFRHFVQTRIRRVPSSVWTRTRWRFGSQRRFVCRNDLLIWLPVIGRLLQILQTRDILSSPFFSIKYWSNLKINDTTIRRKKQIFFTNTPELFSFKKLQSFSSLFQDPVRLDEDWLFKSVISERAMNRTTTNGLVCSRETIHCTSITELFY